jgi:hypothetical protein
MRGFQASAAFVYKSNVCKSNACEVLHNPFCGSSNGMYAQIVVRVAGDDSQCSGVVYKSGVWVQEWCMYVVHRRAAGQ